MGRVELSVNVTVEGMYRAVFTVRVCIECADTEFHKRVSFNISEKHLGHRMQNDGVREAGGD